MQKKSNAYAAAPQATVGGHCSPTQAAAIASGKGGVGKSTICALLGQEMAARGRRVLLVDCDIGLRSLDLILGLDEHVLFTWADVALGRCTLQQAVMVYHQNMHLLCAPLRLEREIADDMLRQIVSTAGEYDAILIDAPAGIGFGFRAAVKAARRCLIVSTPDPVCVRSVSSAAREALRLGCQDIRLVINRFDRAHAMRGSGLMIDDLIDRAEAQLIGVIPQDTALFLQTANGASLGGGIVAEAIARIAARLDGENIPLYIPPSL